MIFPTRKKVVSNEWRTILRPPLSALVAALAFFVISCASAPTERNASAASDAKVDEHPAPASSATKKKTTKKTENPFFEDDDPDAHYDNEDEDEWRITGWFFGFLRGFWHAVTFSGRALR